MNTSIFCRFAFLALPALSLAGLGCAQELPAVSPKEPSKSQPADKASTAKFVRSGKNVFVEIQDGRRRVLVEAYVCLRQGQLEQLLTRKRTKEHEAILAVDADARHIHTALLVAGAKPGSTVKFVKKGDRYVIVPPSGTPIKVTLRYKDKGKLVTVPAQKWVRNIKTGKDLALDWVFAGSVFIKDPLDETAGKPDLYGANDGDVICVANFDTAMLDLPIASSKDNDSLAFEAHTARIPPLNTPVTIILEPVLKEKKK
jgi:hypothetical protein